MAHNIGFYEGKRPLPIGLLWMIALILGIVLGASAAHAQMMNEPWGFTQQNRASIAALMKQTEDSSGASAATASGGYDQLVCGKDGSSSATGNSTCIILNNSDGNIQIGQDSQGDQGATSNTETTTVNALSETLKSIGD